jgi:hypothetical protein
LGFFGGEPAAAALRRRLGEAEEDRFVRYNAAAALARRGDPAAADVVREMLSPRDLEQVVPFDNALQVQNKIEAIVLEPCAPWSHCGPAGSPRARRRAPPRGGRPDRVPPGRVRTEAAACC